MPINKVLVIFKTHLDVGYTDFASNVVEKYAIIDLMPKEIVIRRLFGEPGNGENNG